MKGLILNVKMVQFLMEPSYSLCDEWLDLKYKDDKEWQRMILCFIKLLQKKTVYTSSEQTLVI